MHPTPYSPFVPHFLSGAGEFGRCVARAALLEVLHSNLMNGHETPYLTAEHPALITGGVNQNWAMAHGFTAFAHIHPSGSCSIGVQAPQVWDNLMFEAKRVVPLLEGFDFEIEPCVDGWNFKIKREVLPTFIERLDEIIKQRAYYSGG